MNTQATGNPLAELILVGRSAKPRSRGITMVADWGWHPQRQSELLELAGEVIDLAKIAVGISALLPRAVLNEKLLRYKRHDVTCFPGGQFLEHAVLNKRTGQYFDAVCEVGFDCVEVSDNLLSIDLEAKCRLIRQAREEFHLHVLGEVGRKEGLSARHDPAEDAYRCLEAGAEAVFLEAAEFFTRGVDERRLEPIVDRCGLERLIFELPGPWIRGVTCDRVQELTRALIDYFGSEVNLGNVAADDVLKLEALRRRIGVNAGREQ